MAGNLLQCSISNFNFINIGYIWIISCYIRLIHIAMHVVGLIHITMQVSILFLHFRYWFYTVYHSSGLLACSFSGIFTSGWCSVVVP